METSDQQGVPKFADWKTQEVERVKFIHLAYLIDDFLTHGDRSKENAEFISAFKLILGEPPYGINTFDIWWIIIMFEDFDDLDQMENNLSLETLQLLDRETLISPLNDRIEWHY